MGSTFTVVVIIVAALLACAAFGLALSLQTACCAGAQYGTERSRRCFITAGRYPPATLMQQQAHGPAPE